MTHPLLTVVSTTSFKESNFGAETACQCTLTTMESRDGARASCWQMPTLVSRVLPNDEKCVQPCTLHYSLILWLRVSLLAPE